MSSNACMSIGRVTKYFSMIVSSNPLILINIFYSFENDEIYVKLNMSLIKV